MLALLALIAAPAAELSLPDAMATGDCARVLAEAPPDPGWRLARAVCAMEGGDAPGALEALDAEFTGVYADYARLVRARALLASGRVDEADAAVKGVSLPGAAGRELASVRGEVAVRRADLDAFTALLPALGDTPDARLKHADLLAAKGRTEEAIAAWRRLWRDAAVGGADATAAERLAAHGAGEPALAERQARLKSLRRNGRIDEAAALATELAGTSPDHLELARVNLQARRYADALLHWEKALGKPADAKGTPTAMFDYALTHARAGDYATAAVGYRRLMEVHPTSKEADFASFKLGYMAYDANECAKAGPLFAEHVKRFPDSQHLDEALWFTARCAWRSGEVDAAVAAWTKLASTRPQSSLVPGAAYWKARAKGRKGDAEGERSGLEAVIASWPTSGHAWFAAARLGRTFPAKPAADRAPWPEALASRPEVVRAEALLAVGLRAWAKEELRPLKSSISGKEASLAAAWAFLAAGDYATGQALAKPYCVAPWKGGDPVAQQACTPRPEAGIVGAVAAEYGLDPLLPYGIMTAESNLDPSVTSVAGARGLMQLMPAEGPRIHAALYGDRPFRPDDLYKAPYNASMGTAELGMKHRSLDGVLGMTSLPAVVASYNGGEAAVRRWVEATGTTPDFDEFSEDVGYTETRKYVKRVLGFVMAYRWVYGDPPR